MAVAPRQNQFSPIVTPSASRVDFEYDFLINPRSLEQSSTTSITELTQSESNVISIEQAREKYQRLANLRMRSSQTHPRRNDLKHYDLTRLERPDLRRDDFSHYSNSNNLEHPDLKRPDLKRHDPKRRNHSHDRNFHDRNLERHGPKRNGSKRHDLKHNDPQGSPKIIQVNPKSKPVWLRSLTWCQHISSGVAGLVVGVTLVAYGMTVYMESLWSQEYQTLEALRTEEQQLRAAGEVLKHKIAQETEQDDTGLVPREPANMIFLHPAPLRPEINRAVTPTLESDQQPAALPDKPLAY
ncbi:MAG: hypothetical protein HC835_04530 [Oscillatoriales cyanobacterium RM2_1_1]|nr:hypothetical protein [Oscillatoriales cyanobacterium SM2_3_0]NJO44936.1 hypothetical protein [Oscillatoriales cyanobacterium RM2_1_1]